MAAPNPQEGAQQQPAFKGSKAAEIALSDPLKEETRKARLYLLGVSLVGITIVQTGLVPQEISTLGITFGEADRRSLLNILALVIVYFTLAFTIYGISDLLAWRYAYSNAFWSELNAESKRVASEAVRSEVEALRRHGEAEKLQTEVRGEIQSLPEELRTEVTQYFGVSETDKGPGVDEKLVELLVDEAARPGLVELLVDEATRPGYEVAKKTWPKTYYERLAAREKLFKSLPEEMQTKFVKLATIHTRESVSAIGRSIGPLGSS